MITLSNIMEGVYLHNGAIIGFVEDFDAKKWFGKVTLNGLTEFAEYGTLDSECIVETVDGEQFNCPYINN